MSEEVELSKMSIEIRKFLKISQKKLAIIVVSTQTEISFIEKGFIPPNKNKIKQIQGLYNNIVRR